MPLPGQSPKMPETLEMELNEESGELHSVLALPLGKRHWESFQPSGSLDFTIIKGAGIDAL